HGSRESAKRALAGVPARLFQELPSRRRLEELYEFGRVAELVDQFHLNVGPQFRPALLGAGAEPDNRYDHDERSHDRDDWNPEYFTHLLPPECVTTRLYGLRRQWVNYGFL